jgi:hypothetical protein
MRRERYTDLSGHRKPTELASIRWDFVDAPHVNVLFGIGLRGILVSGSAFAQPCRFWEWMERRPEERSDRLPLRLVGFNAGENSPLIPQHPCVSRTGACRRSCPKWVRASSVYPFD